MTTALTRAGVVPHSYVLTTVGRKSGAQRHNPVTVVELDGRRWLVAPYGTVAWVLNARAAGEVRLTRRFSTTRYTVREVGPDEAGPVLKQYVSSPPSRGRTSLRRWTTRPRRSRGRPPPTR